MLAEPPVGGTAEPSTAATYRHRLLRVSQLNPEVRRGVRRPFRSGRPLSTSAPRIPPPHGTPAGPARAPQATTLVSRRFARGRPDRGLARNSTANCWHTSPDT